MREQEEVDRLVREGLPVVEAVAKRLERKLRGAFTTDELLAIARPVLLDVAREYDPSKAPFAPYLVLRAKWAIYDEARKSKRRQVRARATACAALERIAEEAEREPQARSGLASEAEYQSDLAKFLATRAAALAVGLVSIADTDRHTDSTENPEDRLMREELRRDVRSAVQQLPDRHRALVERHYFGEERFDLIAADIGVSKSWASRLHAQAIDTLAESLRGRE